MAVFESLQYVGMYDITYRCMYTFLWMLKDTWLHYNNMIYVFTHFAIHGLECLLDPLPLLATPVCQNTKNGLLIRSWVTETMIVNQVQHQQSGPSLPHPFIAVLITFASASASKGWWSLTVPSVLGGWNHNPMASSILQKLTLLHCQNMTFPLSLSCIHSHHSLGMLAWGLEQLQLPF